MATGLNKVMIPLPFNQGAQTKTDPKQIPVGQLSLLNNGIFLRTGSISKRWGYTVLGNPILGQTVTIHDGYNDGYTATLTATLENCVAVNTFQKELLSYDGSNAYSYSTSDEGWLLRGSLTSVIQTQYQTIRNNNQQISPDAATLNNITVVAWMDNRGGMRYTVKDAITNTNIITDQPLYSTQGFTSNVRPKVIPFPAAGCIVIFFVHEQDLNYITINPANPFPVSSNFNTLIGGMKTDQAFYDVCVHGNTLFVLYNNSTNVELISFNNVFDSVTEVNVANFVGTPNNGCLSVFIDTNENVCCLYTIGNNESYGYMSIYSFTLATTILSTTQVLNTNGYPLSSLVGIQNPAVLPEISYNIYAETDMGDTYNTFISTNTVMYDGTTGVTQVGTTHRGALRSVGLASKPFQYNNNVFLNLIYSDNLQPTYFTYDQYSNQVSKSNAGIAGPLIANQYFVLPECQEISPGVFQYANMVKGNPITQSGQLFQLYGVNITQMDFLDPNLFLSTEMNQTLITVGGVPTVYDGDFYTEVNFNVYPNPIQAFLSGSGGSIAAGDYQYVVTYESQDNNGNTIYSSPSVAIPVTIAMGSTNSVTLIAPTLRLTNKPNVRVVFYRTTNDGSLLFRVSSATEPVYNDPTSDTVSFIDTFADADIQSNGLCYTQPFTIGTNPILPNIAPPACSFTTSYGNRVWLGGVDDPNTLWFSKQRVVGNPVEFSNTLTYQVDGKGGSITALGVINQALIIFKSNSIYYLQGNGPDNTGSNSDFPAAPTSIVSDVGCINPNSVVVTPLGLMFQSLRGIYLIDSGFNVTYIGSPVEAYNGLAITSANLIPSQWVIFTTQEGTALVYDYLSAQWATFSNHSAVDACTWLGENNAYVFANPDGTIYQQAEIEFALLPQYTGYSTYLDGTIPINLSLTSGWIDLSGINGLQRVYHIFILGTYFGAHQLNIQIGYNYNEVLTNYTTINIPAPGVYGISDPPTSTTPPTYGSSGPYGGTPFPYQFRIDVAQQKCTAIKIQISDSGSKGGQGLALSGMTLRVGIKPQGAKLPSGQQFPNSIYANLDIDNTTGDYNVLFISNNEWEKW